MSWIHHKKENKCTELCKQQSATLLVNLICNGVKRNGKKVMRIEDSWIDRGIFYWNKGDISGDWKMLRAFYYWYIFNADDDLLRTKCK